MTVKPASEPPATNVDPSAETTGSAQPAPTGRKSRLRWVVVTAAILLVLGVAIPVTIAQVRSASITSAASDDADRLARAAEDAGPNLATFAAAVALAEHHEGAFVTPMSAVVNDHEADFDAELTGAFTQSTEALRAVLAEMPAVIGFSSDYRAPQLADVLARRYLAADDEFMQSLRAQAQDEIDRLDVQSKELEAWLEQHHSVAQEVDTAIAQLAASVATVGGQILSDNAQASVDSIAAMDAAIAAVPALDAAALHKQRLQALHDEAVSAELTTLLESVPASLNGYTVAAAEVRASHQIAITPPPPPAPRAGGGGGGGGSGGGGEGSGGGGWCTWTRFYNGFPVWEWGPCSQRP